MFLIALVAWLAACDKPFAPATAADPLPPEPVEIVRIVRVEPEAPVAPPALEVYAEEAKAWSLSDDPTHGRAIALLKLLSDALMAFEGTVDDAEDAASVAIGASAALARSEPSSHAHEDLVHAALEEVAWVLFHASRQLRLGADAEREVDQLREAVGLIDRDVPFLEQQVAIARAFAEAADALTATGVATGLLPEAPVEEMARLTVEPPPTEVIFP